MPRNRDFLKSFCATGILLLAFMGFYGTAYAGTESINAFNAHIRIQKNGQILVTETITYDFGSNERHGIFRDIPLTAKDGPELVVNVSEVRDEQGQPHPYSSSVTNQVFHIKIGDPDVLISGTKTYVISYQAYNAIRTFDDHDELYWNVTGNQWKVAIGNARAVIELPDSRMADIATDCFTGPAGSTGKQCTAGRSGGTVNYAATQALSAGEGLTVVLGMPLGFIENIYVPPPSDQSSSLPWRNFPMILFPIIIVSFVVVVKITSHGGWGAKTKPKPVIPSELEGQPMVVEYNPPDGLPPIEIGTLLDRRVDITDMSSVIMDLAVRGYLKIRYTTRQIKFWPDKKDFELIKLKGAAGLMHPAEKIMFDFLFQGRDGVTLSDLGKPETKFQTTIKQVQKETEEHLREEGYFDKTVKEKPGKLIGSLVIGGILISMFFPPFILVVLVVSVGLGIVISRQAKKLTPQGVATLGKILGFREFLQLTEKDKLELLNAPELRPEIFEKFLPYAMVLGVEEKWAKKFEGIYHNAPAWYEDPTRPTFNSYVLMHNLSAFDSSFNRVFNITSPRSSSGFSGGSSGGGSGGGGGGSW